jgi:Protein of unknown function (DUF3089)
MQKTNRKINKIQRKPSNLIILLVAILMFFSLLIYAFRNNIFKELIGPNIPFQVDDKPKTPDYSDSSAWAKRPQEPKPNQVAVFFAHPSTYYSSKVGWNADLNYEPAREVLDNVVIPNHAMPFNINNNLWIPRYRQAALFATMAVNDDTRGALELAYWDIDAAFDNFEKAIGKDTPFVLVGMNQGALHLSRLIQTKIANSQLSTRLVATYLLDSTIAKSDFNPQNFGNIKICENAKQNGCIITFHAIDDNNNRSQYLFKLRTTLWASKKNYYPLNYEDNICVNPLTGTQDASADAAKNHGSVAANNLENGIVPAFLPFETGAICKDGILLVEHSRSQNLKPPFFELGTLYKVPNYNLFYHNLSEDLKTRIANFNTQKNNK